MAHLSNW